METLIPASLGVLFGLLGLLWGADRFVAGSAAAAKNFGISPLVIGLTIVSIGTSAPEIIVAINAALKDAGDMAVGNAIGSNLANIGLVLGITALVCPIPTQGHLIKQEGPVLLAITLLAGFFIFDGELSRTEGIVLTLIIPPLIALTIYYKKRHPNPETVEEGEAIPAMSTTAALLWFLVGLGALLISSEALVWGAKEFALFFGVSQLIIGLTVVAVGTSLPELAASVMSAIRGHHDIALGNIFGSNLFNLLAVMSVPGIIAPLTLDREVFYRDYVAMSALTLILIIIIAWSIWRGRKERRQGRLSKKVGMTLLTLYALYYAILILGA
ncbi:MAG: calcium/sodium antiporter [Porticoccus sp.]|nr:calcium/sodium antiporter [Porticoccus sp.]